MYKVQSPLQLHNENMDEGIAGTGGICLELAKGMTATTSSDLSQPYIRCNGFSNVGCICWCTDAGDVVISEGVGTCTSTNVFIVTRTARNKSCMLRNFEQISQSARLLFSFDDLSTWPKLANLGFIPKGKCTSYCLARVLQVWDAAKPNLNEITRLLLSSLFALIDTVRVQCWPLERNHCFVAHAHLAFLCATPQ
jgi:hypothetical protein